MKTMIPLKPLLLFSACALAWSQAPASVSVAPFGRAPSGDAVSLYTLANTSGASVSLMDYGATVVRLLMPDRKGHLDDIALGFDTFSPYLKKSPYFGATIGRCANRIAQGRFILDGKSYALPKNNPPDAPLHSLHGGTEGFDKRMWKAEVVSQQPPAVRFSRRSLDGEEGYPGNVDASVTFRLDDRNCLAISYEAQTDKATPVNLTNHTYFNLTGTANGTIRDHLLRIGASRYTPVDSMLIPTGALIPVDGTPFDFRVPTPIGKCLEAAGGKPIGYDHNYVLDPVSFGTPVAELSEPTTGRWMKIYTDQPGLQFYSGNFLDGTVKGKGGVAYPQYTGLCLETQHFPDSPNQPQFPSVILRPGKIYHTRTIYAFGAN